MAGGMHAKGCGQVRGKCRWCVCEALGILNVGSNRDCYFLKILSSACKKLIEPVTLAKLLDNLLLNVIL